MSNKFAFTVDSEKTNSNLSVESFGASSKSFKLVLHASKESRIPEAADNNDVLNEAKAYALLWAAQITEDLSSTTYSPVLGGVVATPSGDDVNWSVTCSFKMDMYQPVEVPADLALSSGSSYQEETDMAFHAETGAPIPIRNSAGQPYPRTFTFDKYRTQLVVTRNEADGTFRISGAGTKLAMPDKNGKPLPTFKTDIISKFKGSLNKVAVVIGGQTFPKLTALMRDITAKRLFHSDYSVYWQVVYSIEFDIQNGFVQSVPDMGFCGKSGSSPALIPFRDREGNVYTEPQYLDGTGKLLALGATPVMLEFVLYRSEDWRPLLLPSELPPPYLEEPPNHAL